MALQPAKPFFQGLGHELFLQELIGQAEGDVHHRAGVPFSRGQTKTGVLINEVIQNLGLLGVVGANLLHAAHVLLQPFEHQTDHIDGKS